jgi:SAM-dependent methyltransferase
MDRLQTELLFHDEQAAARRRYYQTYPDELLVDDDTYLDHETWIRPAFAELGDVAGRRVLDLGCGHGMASVVLARRGARVTACDLSAWYVAEAAERARVNGVAGRVALIQASAEELPFRDGSFDGVWGNAILHHLDLRRAASEIRRVLRPGGVGVFCEPWGENRLLEWARRSWPYPGKERSPDERPLRRRDLKTLRLHFDQVQVIPFQLLGMARRVWRATRLTPVLDRSDTLLLERFPRLGNYCRYVAIRVG